MISELAIADIEQMKTEGLEPSVSDIIKLNALGLKIELNQENDIFNLPRLSFLGKETFREPTLKHNIWIKNVSQYVSNDIETVVGLHAFALSRNEDDLPDFANKELCGKMMKDYCENNLGIFTFRQVKVAVEYAIFGSSFLTNEYPPEDKKVDEDDYINDPCQAVECGLLYQTIALGLNISVREAMKLTMSQLLSLQCCFAISKGLDTDKHVQILQGQYYKTVDMIKKRLIEEKNNGKS